MKYKCYIIRKPSPSRYLVFESKGNIVPIWRDKAKELLRPSLVERMFLKEKAYRCELVLVQEENLEETVIDYFMY